MAAAKLLADGLGWLAGAELEYLGAGVNCKDHTI